MAVKTITIDIEAYELLSKQKLERESFSDVIKRTFRPRPTAGEFLDAIRKNLPSEDVLKRIETVSDRVRKDRMRRIG